MTTFKKRAVFLLLVALSLWPIAHHGLVTTYDMDPWRLFGFSMYSTPKRQVTVLSVDMGWSSGVPAHQRTLGAEQRRAFDQRLKELRNGRKTLGRLYPWRNAFRDMFALLPGDVGELSVTLSQSYLDPQAMLRIRTLTMTCRRSSGGEPHECRQSEREPDRS